MRRILPILLCVLALVRAQPSLADLAATFNSPADVPVMASSYSATGNFSASLNFAPPTGANLMVVKNTGSGFINGKFGNIAQGQVVTLRFGGINYRFIANYHGGTGNDFVLQWAKTRLAGWGSNGFGGVGDGTNSVRLIPTNVFASGVLSGKTVIAASAGNSHSLAVCSDGTVAAWGSNGSGQLGNNSTGTSLVPVLVDSTGVLSGKTVIAVAAGEHHSLALCSDGTIAAWGENFSGQLGNNSTIDSSLPVAVNTGGVLSGKTVVAISAGRGHSLAVRSDGRVAAWGNNDDGQLGNGSTTDSLVPVDVNPNAGLLGKSVIAVAAADDFSLALCSDVTIAAWGANSNGQLGNNNQPENNLPVAVSTSGVLLGKAVVAISAGRDHGFALCSNGTAVAWGGNGAGQLGNGSTESRAVPVAVLIDGVLSGKTVTSIAAGSPSSLAVCSDGSVAGWGYNGSGQLGINSTNNSSVPVAVNSSLLAGGERFTAVFSGSGAFHTFGIVASPAFPEVTKLTPTNVTGTAATLNGTVNPDGNSAIAYFEYGLDTSYGSVASVVLSPNDGVNPQSVSANLTGLTPGTTYHYRLTASNAIGTVSTTDEILNIPINVAASYNSASEVPVTSNSVFATGGTFSVTLNFAPPVGTNLMVVKNTGLAFINGRLDNLTQGQTVTLTYDGIDYEFIANYYGGTGNDLVLQWANARTVAWGSNSNGQIGDNSVVNRRLPASVLSTGLLAGKTVVSLAAGESHSLGLCSDGTMASWGYNLNGQLGNNSNTHSNTPVAVDTSGVLAGKTVIAVAAGGAHSLALCSDGTVAAWGSGVNGGLGNNSTTSSKVPVSVNTSGVLAGKTVVAVSAGRFFNLALCSDGKVVAWGFNGFGALGNNSTVQSTVPVAVNTSGVLAGKTVVAVAAGRFHSLGLCSDGTVAAWGDGSFGQLGNNLTFFRAFPVAVDTTGVLSGKTVVAVAAGENHCLALCSDGMIAAWGNNVNGQLGNGGTLQSSAPVAVSTASALSGKTVVALAAGQNHSMALCSDGTLATWGQNSTGQLGNDSAAQSTIPVALSSSSLGVGERFAAAFSGSYSSHNFGFVAAPPGPMLTTLATSSLAINSAILNGLANGAGGNSAVFFEYGIDSSYGSTVPGNPTTVAGNIFSSVSANLSGLSPNTTYHYRVRATNAAGTNYGADRSFTTLPVQSISGVLKLTPEVAVGANAPLSVSFAGWTLQSMPLSFAVLIDDIVVSAQGTSTIRNIIGPATQGIHTLKLRIHDALGNSTDVPQDFLVVATQADWRAFYFGTSENAGDAADTADPDGDGANNLFEFVAGLSPTNSLSRLNLRVEMSEIVSGAREIIFGPVLPGRNYELSFKSSLHDLTWTSLAPVNSGTDNGTERKVYDFSDMVGPRFYQLKITLP